MAYGIKLWFIVPLMLFLLKLQLLVSGVPQVPCYFIFGDSLVDNGNNNELVTQAKANHPPYGIDFKYGVTGRFTNGRTTADVIAELLGLDDYIPPFATAGGNVILRGVNYGSGGAGILAETGQHLGDHISLDEQLLNHEITVSHISVIQGSISFTKQYLSKCIYTVGMGSNDYINNYLNSQFYPSSKLYTPDQFAQLLIEKYYKQLEYLYKLGARKVAVFGLGKIGCAPEELNMNGINAFGCDENINSVVKLFNDRLIPLVIRLNHNLPGAIFTFINVDSISSADPSLLVSGTTEMKHPCCKVSITGTETARGQCLANTAPCSNREKYAFFDAFHPTEASVLLIAKRSYTALSPSEAFPFDIQHLIHI